MRELERRPQGPSERALASITGVTIVGAGRLGRALAGAFSDAGLTIEGPLGREAMWDPSALPGVVLLCVPDDAIAAAAAAVPSGPVLGHCSGATGLDVLGDRAGFSLHPLMTVTETAPASVFRGAAAAIDATDPRTRELARALAAAAGLSPVAVAADDRAAYHAAASIASNFLITLEAAAERLAETAGVQRAQLVPLVRAAVDNWAQLGAERALTGPVARGDTATVARQRTAVAERTPELLALFDALTDATRRLAAGEVVPC